MYTVPVKEATVQTEPQKLVPLPLPSTSLPPPRPLQQKRLADPRYPILQRPSPEPEELYQYSPRPAGYERLRKWALPHDRLYWCVKCQGVWLDNGISHEYGDYDGYWLSICSVEKTPCTGCSWNGRTLSLSCCLICIKLLNIWNSATWVQSTVCGYCLSQYKFCFTPIRLPFFFTTTKACTVNSIIYLIHTFILMLLFNTFIRICHCFFWNY